MALEIMVELICVVDIREAYLLRESQGQQNSLNVSPPFACCDLGIMVSFNTRDLVEGFSDQLK